MSAVELLFESPPATSGDLVFGLTDSVVTNASALISGSFQPLSVAIQIRPVVFGTITGSFAPLVVAATGSYSSGTARPTVGKTDAGWQGASPLEAGTALPQQDATAAPVGWAAFWERTVGAPALIQHPLPSVFKHTPTILRGVFQDGTALGTPSVFIHQTATRTDESRSTDFQDGTKLRYSKLFRHQDGDRTKRSSRQTEWQNATGIRKTQGTSMQSATPFAKMWIGPHQEGVPPPAGISLVPVTPPAQPCYTPDTDLLFSWPFGYNGTNLVFICGDYTTAPKEPIVVPVRKVYIVANNVALRRVSDNALIVASAVSLSLDVDSWTWSFSASLPGESQALVEPTVTGPVELKVSVNGTDFRVLAENLSRERVFGRTSLRVSGRGRNAVLEAPYAAVQTFANSIERTANQLMEDVLTLNGVPLGWSVTWELDDWVVPAGVFNHQGSYISALGAIAKSAGGYLLPHPSNMGFTVKHLYPTAPWEWGSVTPDFILPADVTTRESLEWREKPAYNRVYVSGEGQGVLGRVTRSGTAGEILAPMVTDQLVTATAAARQRGLAVLGDTGRQIKVGLRLPVLPATGIIQPGSFVQYADGATTRLGLVRGVSVDAKLPDVWQSLEVETHSA